MMRPNRSLKEGIKLVKALRERGEKVIVDLGCGFRKKGTVGIDITRNGTDADLICQLGFETIPLPDNSVNRVVCQDFLEHLPKGYYSERERKLNYPIIDLFNEIWRILKPGGKFISRTPAEGHPEMHRDPTHLSVWNLQSMGYFCGEYRVSKIYGLKETFELVENEMEGFYLRAVLRKPKPEKVVPVDSGPATPPLAP